jgi:hypothetical protein
MPSRSTTWNDPRRVRFSGRNSHRRANVINSIHWNHNKMPTPDPTAAHKHSSHHRAEILAGLLCGCFFCLQTFPPTEIQEWTDDDQTALCPRCGIDAVLGSRSNYPLTEDFLKQMHDRSFGLR